jgi:hypothetical protein
MTGQKILCTGSTCRVPCHCELSLVSASETIEQTLSTAEGFHFHLHIKMLLKFIWSTNILLQCSHLWFLFFRSIFYCYSILQDSFSLHFLPCSTCSKLPAEIFLRRGGAGWGIRTRDCHPAVRRAITKPRPTPVPMYQYDMCLQRTRFVKQLLAMRAIIEFLTEWTLKCFFKSLSMVKDSVPYIGGILWFLSIMNAHVCFQIF